MGDTRMSRREAARQFFLMSAAIAVPGWLATACSKKELSCEDVSGLSADDKATRTTNAYVDKAPDAVKTCAKCQLYKPGPEGQCAGCQLVKGPINPNGYCKSFVAKA
jgi:hypothetical protein